MTLSSALLLAGCVTCETLAAAIRPRSTLQSIILSFLRVFGVAVAYYVGRYAK